MSVALTITDNADGSGGVASITGSGALHSNQVYYSLWTGTMTQLSWTLGGTRTGDGTITLALAVGYYVFQLISNGVIGPAYYQNFTTATTEEHKQVLIAVKVRIDSLSLLVSTKVVEKWLPVAKDVEIANMPMIFVTPVGTEEYKDMVTNQDDVGLPVLVSIVYRQNQDSVANLAQMLLWRNKIAKSLRYQRLAGVPHVYTCQPKPEAILDASAFQNENLLASHHAYCFISRQIRGLT